MLSKGSEEPLAQGRCSGYGGGFKAVKISGGCGSESCEEHIEQPKTERKEMDMFALERKYLPVHLAILSALIECLVQHCCFVWMLCCLSISTLSSLAAELLE